MKKRDGCVYEQINPANYKTIPQGSCVKYNCSKSGDLVNGVVCSYMYETKDSVSLKVEDSSGGVRKVTGRPVWVERKKGGIASSQMHIDALRDEVRLHKREIDRLKKNISELTVALKLIKEALKNQNIASRNRNS